MCRNIKQWKKYYGLNCDLSYMCLCKVKNNICGNQYIQTSSFGQNNIIISPRYHNPVSKFAKIRRNQTFHVALSCGALPDLQIPRLVYSCKRCETCLVFSLSGREVPLEAGMTNHGCLLLLATYQFNATLSSLVYASPLFLYLFNPISYTYSSSFTIDSDSVVFEEKTFNLYMVLDNVNCLVNMLFWFSLTIDLILILTIFFISPIF